MERERFASSRQFLCSCLSYTVGLGNLWRFPYVCYKNGGAAFLVPYILVTMLIGRPVYFLELLLGQFSGHGPLGAFRLSPMFQGNAFAMMWAAFVISIYYQMVVTYAIIYFFASFRNPLPWNECYHWWGVSLDGCFARQSTDRLCDSVRKSIVLAGVNDTGAGSLVPVTYGNKTVFISQQDYSSLFAGCVNANASSTEVFYNKYVLDLSSDIELVGDVQPTLVLAYAISWIIIFLTIFRGMQVLGKLLLVTATIPYIILTIMLVRGITLPGSGIGITYLVVPTWSKILDLNVWRAAIEQAFVSLSIGTGGLMLYGSYLNFRSDARWTVRFICFVDFLTSALAAFVVFAVLGNMSFRLNMPIEDVVNQGPALAFATYTEVVSLIPFPYVWSVFFFAVLFLKGIDSQMANCEILTTSIQGLFPGCSGQRFLSALMYCSTCFLIGLCLTTQVGFYILAVLDHYLGAIMLLVTCFFETLIVGWVYGMNRFCFDVTFMTGICPSYFFVISIKYATPVVLGTLLVHVMVTFPRSSAGLYTMPIWADVFGWALVAVGLMPIILVAVAKLFECNFNCRKAISPERDWGPYDDKYHVRYKKRLQELGYTLLHHSVSPISNSVPGQSPRNPRSQSAMQSPKPFPHL
ncbi:sodium and chloride-dependent glycine transporter 2-like [Ixodes scapularis]